MELKTFKTLEEQVQILRSKNMVINDEHYAKEVLLRENYFFIPTIPIICIFKSISM